MNKKYVYLIILCVVLVTGFVLTINKDKKYQDDENTLYSIRFANTRLRFERYDYALGQNQIIGVEKSSDKGKTYKKVTKEAFTVSMEPQFIFLNKKLGFVISKPNLSKTNNYQGVMVTNDGGVTFTNGIINYDNPNIDIMTVEELPYYDSDKLVLHCSIYQIKNDNSGYENIDLYFSSHDNGLTWNIE